MITAEDTKPTYELKDNDLVMAEAPNRYVLRVRDLPGAEKPREKMIAYGPTNLSLSEIVAVVLGVGSKKEEVMHMSQRILKEYGERSIVHETNPERMAEILDIPVLKACQLIAAFELGRRFYATKAGRPVFIRTAAQAYEYLKTMGELQKEELISVGSLTANIVHPREVFKPAIEHGAVGVIIAHNHPSGNVQPTEADLIVTTQVQSAGTILGIDLLDHIVITHETYKSILG